MAKDIGRQRLDEILDRIRPALERDGGDLELVKFDKKNGVVDIRFQGACAHCPISDFTLKNLIEQEIMQSMPEIKEVRSV